MDPFPERWELVSLFESEPEVDHPDEPWPYTRARLSLVRGDGRLDFQDVPADQEVDLTYTVDGRVVVALALRRVLALRVYQEQGTEGLEVTMQDASRGDLRVQTAPDITFVWQEVAG